MDNFKVTTLNGLEKEAVTELAEAKSFKRGDFTDTLLEHIYSLSKDDRTKKMFDICLKGFKTDIESMAYDTIYYKGDLHINHSFNTFKSGICNLFIEGDLYVEGTIFTYDDPSTLIFVTGNVVSDNIINAGSFFVCGNLEVKHCLLGNYNHGMFVAYGDTKAELFYPEDHSFDLYKEINFKYAFGNTSRLNKNKSKKAFNFKEKDFKKLLSILHPNVLKLMDEEYKEIEDEIEYTDEIWEFLDVYKFYNYVEQGKPVLK